MEILPLVWPGAAERIKLSDASQRQIMKDREYLMWLHERLEHVHGENPMVDYLHKLRAIIRATPEKRETPNCNSCTEKKAMLDAVFTPLEGEPPVRSSELVGTLDILGLNGDKIFERIRYDLDRGLIKEARSHLNFVDVMLNQCPNETSSATPKAYGKTD